LYFVFSSAMLAIQSIKSSECN